MLICIKQHLNNIWRSTHGKVKQRLSSKKVFVVKRKCSIDFFIPINIFAKFFSWAPYKILYSLRKLIGYEVARTRLAAMKSFWNWLNATDLKWLFNVNNIDTKNVWNWKYFKPFSGVSIIDFDLMNFGFDISVFSM